MKCKNRFCVFNISNTCTKNDMELNECGSCEDFFYPSYLRGLTDGEKLKFLSPLSGIENKIYKVEYDKYKSRREKSK